MKKQQNKDIHTFYENGLEVKRKIREKIELYKKW